jgi:hypothetical protein
MAINSIRQTKTTTIERNVDDDYTDGSKNNIATTTTKTKSMTVTSPYAIPKDISVSSISTTVTSTTKSGRHHNKTENSDDTVIVDDDDNNFNPNATTPTSDMLDIVNENINRSSSNTHNDGVFVSYGKIVLPPEHEPNETWIIAIVTLFTSMAISLCITTAIRRCRKRRRTGYAEIDNIVV